MLCFCCRPTETQTPSLPLSPARGYKLGEGAEAAAKSAHSLSLSLPLSLSPTSRS
jgi:hypothetical protein